MPKRSEQIVEKYIETIGGLEQLASPVSTSSIAESLDVSQASVCEMLDRLEKKELVNYTRYAGTTLTEAGRRRYLKLMRRHRLWEVFLNRHLGIDWENVYEHAADLERATSELVTERLAKFLDNPPTCPHGNPIPRSETDSLPTGQTTLDSLEIGQTASVASVSDESSTELLSYLSAIGVKPGVKFKLVQRMAFDDSIVLDISGSPSTICQEAASLVTVTPE